MRARRCVTPRASISKFGRHPKGDRASSNPIGYSKLGGLIEKPLSSLLHGVDPRVNFSAARVLTGS